MRRLQFLGILVSTIAALAGSGPFFPGRVAGQVQSMEAMVQDDVSHRQLYDDDDAFNALSGAARSMLERRYGKKPRPGAQQTEPASGKSVLEPGQEDELAVTVSPNVLVNNPAADATPQDTQSETALVLGSGSDLIAAFNDSGSFSGNFNADDKFTGFSRSTNSGTSWTDGGTLPTNPNGDLGDPVLARSTRVGRTYLSTLQFSGTGIRVFRSDNDAANWLQPIQGAPGLAPTDFADKDWIAVDNSPGPGNGNVYLVFRRFQGGAAGDIRLTRSTDNGTTFGPPGGMVIASAGAYNVQGAFVTVGPGHVIYVFWLDQSAGSGTRNVIKMRKSADLGQTFGAPVTVATLRTTGVNGDLNLLGGFRTNAFPQAAVNPVNGHVYVVYNDRTPGTDSADVYLRRSANGGATWSAPIRVNDDATVNDQWQPTLAVTPDGTRVFIGFYDRRRDDANDLIDTFGAVATIAGSRISFQPNFRISTRFPVVIGQDPIIIGDYMGDYDQAAADNNNAYYTWGDNRLSNAFHANQPDVRFARISLPNPIDDPQYFVRQHYLDFLLREPDPGGWDEWVAQITQCGSNQFCIDQKRIEVSRGFWDSAEFQQQPRTNSLLNPNPPPQYVNREFVRLAYVLYLARNPDQGGWDYWTANLNNCTNPNPPNSSHCYDDVVIRGFINSTEYRGRFGTP
ncbi:MAG TPA: DUF4214 domain-containing protein [Blastocatellia bacterium]|nr:DUF4214 domain-containing protein [Blastocatellia bacterium]